MTAGGNTERCDRTCTDRNADGNQGKQGQKRKKDSKRGKIALLRHKISNLQGWEVVVNQESQASNRHDQELHSEGVMIPIVGRLELHVDQVHSGVRASDVDDLKDGDKTSLILLRILLRNSAATRKPDALCWQNLSFGKHRRVVLLF